jgi:methionyl aminopeptidase
LKASARTAAAPAPAAPLAKEALSALREAGRIASRARYHGAALIRPGVPLLEVCLAVEEFIRGQGASLAFPVQTSVNHVAAHDCPGPEDVRTYAQGDLAKLDVGTHIEGYVVDTATTVAVGAAGKEPPLVVAARAALEAALQVAGPHVPIWRLSAAIATTLRTFGARPMRNLCGHHVGRWTVHCPPAVPNLPEDAEGTLQPWTALAIEPFATDGPGRVTEEGEAQVFRLLPGCDPGPAVAPAVREALLARRGLPFSRRDLGHLPRPEIEAALRHLREKNMGQGYAPLVETTRRLVTQAEHTILVTAAGVEVLTL